MDDLITIDRLTKNYGKVEAVKELDLKVRRGEIFGFLGPNGAGKTTTMRVMTTLTKPNSGRVSIDGLDVVKEGERVKELIGVVQQHLSLDRDLSIRENMVLHARLHRMRSTERENRIRELIEYAGLSEHADKMVDVLSGGMKKRATIMCALLHRPQLLFLDEPTVGLDAQTRRRMWDLVRRLNSDGTTIFLTTHYIEEAQALCDRVGIIDHGRLIALGSPLELRQKLGMVAVEMQGDNNGTRYQYFSDRAGATRFVQDIASQDQTIIIRESNLEDVFVELTGQKVGDA
jgi:ABC-2 type transport system ATP-binding protein